MWNLLADSNKLIPPHAGRVSALRLSPDGRRVASIGEDAAKVWSVSGAADGAAAAGQCLATLDVSCLMTRTGEWALEGQLDWGFAHLPARPWFVTGLCVPAADDQSCARVHGLLQVQRSPGAKLKSFMSVCGRRATLQRCGMAGSWRMASTCSPPLETARCIMSPPMRAHAGTARLSTPQGATALPRLRPLLTFSWAQKTICPADSST